MKPYYEDESVTLFLGDCLDVLPSAVPSSSVDLVLTDPPYNVSFRNGRANTSIGKLRRPGGTHREIRRDFGEWDYDWNPRPFLGETARVLRDGGSMVAFLSEFLFSAYLDSGLNHRCVIYWRKTNPAPAFRSVYVRSIEMAVWQVKGERWTFNASGYRPNVWEIPILNGYRAENIEPRVHPTQKPVELMADWIAIHSNEDDVVCDPHAGSGTTGVAAKLNGRKAILIEREEKYCEVAAKRLSETRPGRLFEGLPKMKTGKLFAVDGGALESSETVQTKQEQDM